MRKKSRGGTRLVEVALFLGLLIVVGVVVALVAGLTTISAFFSPPAPTVAPALIVGGLPTPAPTVTRTPQPKPTALATPQPTAPTTALATQSGQVLLVSHLRSQPQLSESTQQAILCPDDSVEFLAQRMVEDLMWYHVRVTKLGASCNANHAAVGTEGWASSNVVSPPSEPVAAQ